MEKGAGRLSKEEVEHVAWLARIELSEEEKELFTRQFNDILAYFRKIDELDTEHIPPTHHVIEEQKDILREDEVEPCMPREEALRNAPRKENGHIKAPRIL